MAQPSMEFLTCIRECMRRLYACRSGDCIGNAEKLYNNLRHFQGPPSCPDERITFTDLGTSIGEVQMFLVREGEQFVERMRNGDWVAMELFDFFGNCWIEPEEVGTSSDEIDRYQSLEYKSAFRAVTDIWKRGEVLPERFSPCQYLDSEFYEGFILEAMRGLTPDASSLEDYGITSDEYDAILKAYERRYPSPM